MRVDLVQHFVEGAVAGAAALHYLLQTAFDEGHLPDLLIYPGYFSLDEPEAPLGFQYTFFVEDDHAQGLLEGEAKFLYLADGQQAVEHRFRGVFELVFVPAGVARADEADLLIKSNGVFAEARQF